MSAAGAAGRPDAVRVVACRGCCCGNAARDPHVDHAGELALLRRIAAASGGGVTVRTSECLGPCADRNIVVVAPSRAGRAAGGRPVWFGRLDPAELVLLGDWVGAGGPGRAGLPPALRGRVVTPRSVTAEAQTLAGEVRRAAGEVPRTAGEVPRTAG